MLAMNVMMGGVLETKMKLIFVFGMRIDGENHQLDM